MDPLRWNFYSTYVEIGLRLSANDSDRLSLRLDFPRQGSAPASAYAPTGTLYPRS
jgi:hypothetical protein